ncbi:MAG TPA: FixH family protein [Flavobacteriales bacterium]|nr:FixH family protein [Flavobacteriales bacterium]
MQNAKPKNMNWGKGLAISLIAFAAMMAAFGIASARRTETLVTENYYAEELRYQERIDAKNRTKALSAPVSILIADDRVRLQFPAEMMGKAITGRLKLLRPNDARADRDVDIAAEGDGAFVTEALDLWPGRYDASLEWQVDGITYHTAEKLVAP